MANPTVTSLLRDSFNFNTIRGRIFTLVLFLVAAIALIATALVRSTNHFRDQLAHIEQVTEPLSNSQSLVKQGLYQAGAAHRSYLLTQQPAFNEERVNVWNEQFAQARQLIYADSTAFDSTTLARAATLDSLLMEYKQVQENLNSLVENAYIRPNANAEQLLAANQQQKAQIQRWLNDYVVPVEQQVTRAAESLTSESIFEKSDEFAAVTAEAKMLKSIILWISFITIAVALYIGYRTLDKLINAVNKPSNYLAHLAEGEFVAPLKAPENELKPIVIAANKVRENLLTASEFATAIGNGEFDHEFTPAGDNDNLGNSLLLMRGQLKAVSQEDRNRNWISTGLAKFSQLLRQEHNSIGQMADELLSQLVRYMKINQAGLFILNEPEHDEPPYLELIGAFAYDRKKYLEKQVVLEEGGAEGLVGQVYQQKKIMHLQNVPPQYIKITSGLGGAVPRALLLVPLVSNEQCMGVLELAAFKPFEEHEVEFAEQISQAIATSFAAIRGTTKMRQLLEETQQQSQQMQAQEEEMRQNMEELSATQEEMQRRQQELERLKLELEDQVATRTAEVTNLLERHHLANINASHGFWDLIVPENGQLSPETDIYFSARFKQMLGYKEDEFDNNFASFLEHIHPDDQEQVMGSFFKIFKDPERNSFAEELRMRMADGNYTPLRAIGNLKNNEQGQPVRFAGTITNILAEKQLSEKSAELQQSVKKINDITYNVPGVVYQYYFNPATNYSKYTYVSARSIDVLGIESGKILGTSVFDKEAPFYVKPGQQEAYVNALQQSGLNQEDFYWEGQVIPRIGLHKDEVIWISIESKVRVDKEGAFVWDGLIQNINARKELEQELEETKQALEKYKTQQQLVHAHGLHPTQTDAAAEGEHQSADLLAKFNSFYFRSWADDTRTLTYLSDGAEQVLNTLPKQLLQQELWFTDLLPEKKQHQKLVAAIREASETGEPYTIYYRVQPVLNGKRDASVAPRLVMERGYPIKNSLGNFTQLEGLIVDVTDLRPNPMRS